ncbi:MAG: hypothetical protein AAGK93_07915 [Pseudomonadota bacterium]
MPDLPTFTDKDYMVVHYMPIDPVLVFFGIFFVIFFVFVYAALQAILWPYKQQKKRELQCEHVFDRYQHTPPNGKTPFYTYFCKKCGARYVISQHHEIAEVKKSRPRQNRRKKT